MENQVGLNKDSLEALNAGIFHTYIRNNNYLISSKGFRVSLGAFFDNCGGDQMELVKMIKYTVGDEMIDPRVRDNIIKKSSERLLELLSPNTQSASEDINSAFNDVICCAH